MAIIITLAHFILLSYESIESEPMTLGRNLDFSVSRKNAAIEVIFLIRISFVCSDSHAPPSFIVYEPTGLC